MDAIELRCEYLIDPLGIDVLSPRIFWKCQGDNYQTAYQINAEINGKPAYDSGKVISSKSNQIILPLKLASRDIVKWKVRLWNENDEVGEYSPSATFEMGLLQPTDWKAKWIRGDYKAKKKSKSPTASFKIQERYPLDYFKKEFNVNSVIKARLYITSCGIYQAYLNDQRIGEYVLAPGHTDYNKHINYQTYDVTSLIKKGLNILSVELGDGWYRGSLGAWGKIRVYGHQTKFIAQLEIETNEGLINVCSDSSFSWSNDGKCRFNDLKDGEIIDNNLVPTYKGYAREVSEKLNLKCSNNYEIRENEHFKAKLITTPKNCKVLDFGQNIAGFIEFDITAHKGDKITLKMGEILNPEGEFTQDNIQMKRKEKVTPLQKVEFICKEGKNHYKTSFATFGFRYAQIETNVTYDADQFTAIAVYSALPNTLKFNSSNPLLNKFVECVRWSMKGNTTDVPTDCPTRERNSWSGDAQIFAITASYLTLYAPFAKKYEKDLIDRQSKNGKFHQMAPIGGDDFWMEPMNGSVGWACAGVLIPYRIWKMYDDDEILLDSYDAMAKYGHFMINRAGKLGLFAKPLHLSKENRKYAVNKGQSYGEWAEPNDVKAFSISDFVSPHPEESTAYTYFTLAHLAEISLHLGKKEDYELFHSYSEGAKKAYQELVTKEGFTLDTDRQAKLVRPLFMNLLTKEQTEFAKKRLIQAMEHYKWRVGTGFLSTPLILYVLSDIDISYAYRLLENEECPGWLFMPKSGGTTIFEAWEGATTPDHGIASMNHYSKGAVLEWVFKKMCGVNIVGENQFNISPLPGGSFKFAEMEFDSLYGKVKSSWTKNGDKYHFEIELPANSHGKFNYKEWSYELKVGLNVFDL